MNFRDFIDNDRQKLVNEVNTIGHNLSNIFDLTNSSRDSERFYGKINGLSVVEVSIKKDLIQFSVPVTKLSISFDKDKTKENVYKNLFPKLSSQNISLLMITEFAVPLVTISFSELTPNAVKDIMILMNNSEAKLRASSIGKF